MATHCGRLTSPHLPDRARNCYLLPEFPDSLLSIPRLCDAGHRVLYDVNEVTVHGPDGPVLRGPRSHTSGLWTIDLASSPTAPRRIVGSNFPATPAHALNAAPLPTVASRVAWGHAAMGSPTEATLLAAIKKDFIRLPGLSSTTLQRYPPLSIATAEGHLARHRANLRSSKKPTFYATHRLFLAPPAHRPFLPGFHR